MTQDSSANDSRILKIFNYVGGTLIFLGIAYFIANNWSILNNFTRIFTTLGSAIAAFMAGALFHASHKYESAASAFFMISGLLLPIGLGVTLIVSNVSWGPEEANLLIFGISLAAFMLALFYSPRAVFLLFTIIFASLFYLSLISFLTSEYTFYYDHLLDYEVIALGSGYIFLGYYLDSNNLPALSGPLYFFGGLFVLFESFTMGSNFFIGYNQPRWEIVTGILIILSFAFSVPLKSKSFLYLGAIFLILYIGDISSRFIELFGDLGWSLILVIMGLVLMLIGYLVFVIHKKINRIKLD